MVGLYLGGGLIIGGLRYLFVDASELVRVVYEQIDLRVSKSIHQSFCSVFAHSI